MGFQESFEDDNSKILMILCVSPDPKELYKTISTLEYGAKAKCIIRAPETATPMEKMSTEESPTTLKSRIVVMNQFIYKLQNEQKLLQLKVQEIEELRLSQQQELATLKQRLQEVDHGKESSVAEQREQEGLLKFYIKWEPGNLIEGLKLLKNSCLSYLRKLIEGRAVAHFEEAGNKE